MSLTSFIAASGALLGLLIAAALWLTRGPRAYANRVLAALTLVSASYLLSLVSMHSPELVALSPLRMGGLSIVLFGPVLYCYVLCLVRDGKRLGQRQLLHLLPYLLVVVDSSGLWGEGVLLSRPKLFGVLFYLLTTGYLLAAGRLLLDHQRGIQETYSSLEGVSLRWLATLVATSLLLCLIGLAFALVRWLVDGIQWPQGVWSIAVMTSVNYLIAFFAISRPVVFSPAVVTSGVAGPDNADARVESVSEQRDVDTPASYATSSLTPEVAQQIWSLAESLMGEQRPYLQNDLKIGDLATMLDLPVSHLSQTINQVGGCSFFAYINRYRVQAARHILANTPPGEQTMLAVAMASGFNSESVFYKHFRKAQGMTPRQYQQEMVKK